MNLNLENRNALVCGSSQGIGKAAAIELAKMGASIFLLARNEEKLKQVKSALDTSKGQKHHILIADFQDNEKVKRVVEDCVNENPIHILINNTGGPPGGNIENATDTEFLNAFQQHLINNHNISSIVKESMKTEGYGRIINVISTSVKVPLKGLGVSNTIRGAVANWSKTMANELGAYGITVNNVLPGATLTERLESIIENKANKTASSIEQVEKLMQSQVPMNRFASAEEIANAVAFLASPAASYINGINLPVDGGRTPSL